MSVISSLFWRELRLFWRHRAGLALAAGVPVVLVVLYLIGMLDPVDTRIVASLSQTAGDSAHGAGLAWVFATVAVLSVFTTTAGFTAAFSEQRQAGRFDALQLAPVKRWQLSVAHLGAVAVTSLAVALIVVAAGQFWVLILGQEAMAPLGWLRLLGGLVLVVLCFTGLAGLAASVDWSRAGFGAYAALGLVGTGFLSYSFVLPRGIGPAGLLGVLPFAQSAALVRHPMLSPVFDQYAATTANGALRPLAGLGAEIQLSGSLTWSPGITALVLAVWAALLLVWAVVRLNRTLDPARV